MAEYIDRAAVHRMMVGLTEYVWKSSVSREIRTTVDADDVKFGVDKIPAADVEPVVHARWEKRDGQTDPGVFCSACGEYEGWARKRCPSCGAKMDEE